MKKLYEEAPNSFKRTYDSAKRDAKIWKLEGEKIEKDEGHKIFWPDYLLKK
jgi:hypothetical protein